MYRFVDGKIAKRWAIRDDRSVLRQLYRFVDGKIAKRWAIRDDRSVLRQLGAIPAVSGRAWRRPAAGGEGLGRGRALGVRAWRSDAAPEWPHVAEREERCP
jgi:hypothetical protein